jgi:hypothetical protein
LSSDLPFQPSLQGKHTQAKLPSLNGTQWHKNWYFLWEKLMLIETFSLQLEFNYFLSPISNQRLKRKKNKDLYQSWVYKKKWGILKCIVWKGDRMTNIEKKLQNHHLQCCETLRKGAEK